MVIIRVDQTLIKVDRLPDVFACLCLPDDAPSGGLQRGDPLHITRVRDIGRQRAERLLGGPFAGSAVEGEMWSVIACVDASASDADIPLWERSASDPQG